MNECAHTEKYTHTNTPPKSAKMSSTYIVNLTYHVNENHTCEMIRVKLGLTAGQTDPGFFPLATQPWWWILPLPILWASICLANLKARYGPGEGSEFSLLGNRIL